MTRRRVLFFGASNVTRSFGTLVAAARAVWNEPLEIFAAHGHGRSYGASTNVLVRKLPGILSCGLWNRIRQLPAAPTAALVTDIGNDILYEFSVPMIADWVERCLDRLAEIQCATTVTALPVDNIPALSEARFKFFRTLLMPGCGLSLSEVSQRAFDLNERVRSLVLARGMEFVSGRHEWYGFDPIHIRKRYYSRAWPELLSRWHDEHKQPRLSRGKLTESIYLRTRLPEQLELFGRTFGASQPCARLRDGTIVSLY